MNPPSRLAVSPDAAVGSGRPVEHNKSRRRRAKKGKL